MLAFSEVEGVLEGRRARVASSYDVDEQISQVAHLDEMGTRPALPGCLYVGYVSTFRTLGIRGQGSFVLVDDEDSGDRWSGPRANVVLVDNTDDIDTLFELLGDAVRTRRSGEGARERLLSILLRDNDLSALVQTAAELLGNPILATDSSYNILAHSVHPAMDDKVWSTGWQRGYLTFEFIAQLKGASNGFFESDPARTSLVVAGISEHRRRILKLVFQGLFIGYLVVLEDLSPLEETPEETYRVVRDVLAKQVSIERSPTGHTFREPELNLLSDLLEGRVLNRLMFRELVGSTSFRKPATYRVLCIDMRFSELTGSTVQDRLRHEIGAAFPGAYSLFLEESILVLLSERAGAAREGDAHEAIGAFLSARSLSGGLSEGFDDLFDLAWHYEQGRQALRFGELEGDPGPLHDYAPYRTYHLLSLVPVERLERLASPAVIKLARDDQARGEALLTTLDEYLRSRGSVSETARRCYVHRNTVSYRLARLREVYGIDLDDPDRAFSYETSCAIVRYLRLVEGRKTE